MKKTYITTMPDHIGAFLKASECFASLGVNITRVSYNKAIDSHTLFIDAEGDRDQLEKADRELKEIGYLPTDKNENSIVLLEFMLRDKPGSVTEVLKLIDRFRLNISYISSQENGSAYQAFKMGLFMENENVLKNFLREAQELCPVRVLDGVSLSVGRGRVLGLCGENGAGKSTLLRCVAGQLAPDAGSVRIDAGGDGRIPCRMVPQEPALVEGMTVAENLYLGREGVRFGLLDRTLRQQYSDPAKQRGNAVY